MKAAWVRTGGTTAGITGGAPRAAGVAACLAPGPALGLALGVALALALGCAGRGTTIHHPGEELVSAGELRQVCPAAVAATVRIRLEPRTGPGATIDGTLRAVLPDTLALTGRLGVFHPLFALRADADSAELLVHDARRYWVTARDDEDWSLLNPSAWARALAWALCPGDLLDRLDEVRLYGGDHQTTLLLGRLRGSPYMAELGIERRTSRLTILRIREGESLVMELRQRDFRRHGPAVIPSVVEIRIPPQGPTARVEVLSVKTSRPDRALEVGRLRPRGWAPAAPGEQVFPIPRPGQDPG